MASNEDWRRQRAEELRLHDPGPWRARPARDVQPAADGVEPMRRPATRTGETPLGSNGAQARATTVEDYRPLPEAAFSSATAAPRAAARTTSQPAAMPAPVPPGSPRLPPPSFAARHPLAVGTAVGAALVTGGAIGWLLHAQVEPGSTSMPMPMPMIVHNGVSRPATAPHSATALPAHPSTGTPTAPPTHAEGASIAAAPVEPIAPPVPVTKRHLPENKQSSIVHGATFAKPAGVIGFHSLPGMPTVRARAATPMHDTTSRWAHRAKAVALPGHDFGPSFNCRRAISTVNRAICTNPQLSSLDRQVSQSFYSATAHADLERHKAIDRDQTDFLNQRSQCNSDSCVAAVYQHRLDSLRQTATGE